MFLTDGHSPIIRRCSVPEDPKCYCVYTMGSLSGTLYIGFSGHLHRLVFQHKFHHFEGFTDRYDVTRLLCWESMTTYTRHFPERSN